ncbi:hypothetical protein GGTG_08485 [Gaeumannomyces tritici R3-111a-1]|uniref:Aminoglycoside phosphotransferase domain-containing protein n=1 Tax=Gaeumannomyces tritici (strain R3-111a-1) TaxID=644352 RepID=J3P4P8_GAET3|nr:hypothetical protein GGTG_08485 [Gaeumannomyces tritici R3-111a-1]EJT74645.1 hypothetical protein GGTG_08485 [Gaeumannomyces tritici R3-111a-1]
MRPSSTGGGLQVADDPARAGHAVCFTHAGLNAGNVLLDYVLLQDGTRGWTITGIVDWEISGFFPKYWEFTNTSPRHWWSTTFFAPPSGGNDEYGREYQLEQECWFQGAGCPAGSVVC